MARRLAGVVAIAIFIGAAHAQEARPGIDELPSFERRGIEKLARMSAADHSTILFTIFNETVGYAKDGAVGRIGSDWKGRCNRWTHSGLSHDGARVAYVTDGEQDGPPLHNCRIAIYDFAKGSERTLIATSDDPGEISWSWDDMRIVYLDRWEEGLSEVSVATGDARTIHGDSGGRSWVWYPMQWLHDDRGLVLERSHEAPTGAPNTYTEQSDLFRLEGGISQCIAPGSSPSVSPRLDQIAYFDGDNVMTINADGTGKRMVAKAPRTFLGLFFPADLMGPIVWSPDGGRLLFRSLEDEDGSGRLFVLDLKSGKLRTLQSGTTIFVRGWAGASTR
jgi:hypothetical protein